MKMRPNNKWLEIKARGCASQYTELMQNLLKYTRRGRNGIDRLVSEAILRGEKEYFIYDNASEAQKARYKEYRKLRYVVVGRGHHCGWCKRVAVLAFLFEEGAIKQTKNKSISFHNYCPVCGKKTTLKIPGLSRSLCEKCSFRQMVSGQVGLSKAIDSMAIKEVEKRKCACPKQSLDFLIQVDESFRKWKYCYRSFWSPHESIRFYRGSLYRDEFITTPAGEKIIELSELKYLVNKVSAQAIKSRKSPAQPKLC